MKSKEENFQGGEHSSRTKEHRGSEKMNQKRVSWIFYQGGWQLGETIPAQ